MTKEVDTMNFRPGGDRLLVLLDEQTEMSEGGIHLPEIARGSSRRGTVVAVGPGRRCVENGLWSEIQFSVDDVVVLDPVGGIPLRLNGKDYLVVREAEVLGSL